MNRRRRRSTAKKAGAGPKKKRKPCLWITSGLGRLERTEHVRVCILCKELLDQCVVADSEYTKRAKAVIVKHIKKNPKPDGLPCHYSGCVHHEKISRELGLAMLRVTDSGKPWRDIQGVKVGTISLVVTEKDHPEGYDMKRQDAQRRHFKEMEDDAGDIYIRFGQKQTWLHVWISLSYSSRRANVDDPAAIWNVLEAQEKQVGPVREWCLRRFQEIRGLGEMELQFQKEEN